MKEWHAVCDAFRTRAECSPPTLQSLPDVTLVEAQMGERRLRSSLCMPHPSSVQLPSTLSRSFANASATAIFRPHVPILTPYSSS